MPELELAQPGLFSIFTEAAAPVASMVVTPITYNYIRAGSAAIYTIPLEASRCSNRAVSDSNRTVTE